MKRLGVEDPTPFLEFAQKTKQIESSGGVNRINPNSSARGDFQWLTKVNPKAKKGVHGSVKTAVNRTIASYKKVGQEIPEWLKTLDSNSTKSTKDLEKNILSLTPDKELELFFGNMNYATDSDKYLKKIAKGDKEAMYGAYSDIHHTRGREDKTTQKVAIKIFYGNMPEQIQPDAVTGGLTETITDTRPSELYTVKPKDTLSELATKSGMSIKELMDANLSRISDPNKIYAGQQIALPNKSIDETKEMEAQRIRDLMPNYSLPNYSVVPEAVKFYSNSPDLTGPVSMSKENEEGLMSLIRSYLPNFLTRAEGGQIQPYFEGKVIGPGDGQSDQVLFDVEGKWL
jgi:LysM repeat protein